MGCCTGERTGIDDEEVLLLVLVDVADTGEQKTRDGVLCRVWAGRRDKGWSTYFVANDSNERSVLEGCGRCHTESEPRMATVNLQGSLSSPRTVTNMDIFNRGPSVSEDTLLYVLYPPPPLSDNASCTSLAASITDLVPTLLPNFLWHRDPFQLKIAPDPDARRGEEKNILEGRMRVGDAVDDEWCAVWLLREISKRWDVVIRFVRAPPTSFPPHLILASASDSDGEFLLIEAAESLPRWVNPSNAINRVRTPPPPVTTVRIIS